MKKNLLFVVAVMMTFFVSAQTVVFQENFESGTIGLTSTADSSGFPTTNFKAWAASTQLYKSGLKADSNVLQVGKTIYLTSNSFSTTGNSFVFLEFSQICKLYFADGGIIEVSVDGGTTWIQLGNTEYLGTGTLFTSGGGSKFSDNAYSDWVPGTNTIPDNSWWKNEKFNISTIAGNQANVKIRFKYTGSGQPNGIGRYGWLLDDIKVTASASELTPPVITMISYPTDTVFNVGPYNVSAFVKDASGIDTVFIMYKIGNGSYTQLGMVKSPVNDSLYTAGIPNVVFGKTITYNITARDASGSHNLNYKPITGYYTFITKYSSGGNVIIGTATSTQNYPFKSLTDSTKSASIYKSSEINRFGLINQLQWHVSNAQAGTTIPVKIYIKHTSASSMTADTWDNLKNGAILVYDGPQTFTTNGWKTIVLTTPFIYNSGNLMVLCEANYGGSGALVSPAFYYTSVTSGLHQYFISSVYTTGILNAQRPNITLGFVTVPLPTQDAGISEITGPSGSVTAGTAFDVNVKIKNFGSTLLTTATAYYTIDGNISASFPWAGSLLKDSTGIFPLGNLNLAVGMHNLKIWTDLPNNNVDQNNANDTAYFSFFACAGPLTGNYTVGGTGANFPTFADVYAGLSQCGISGPVVFNIAAGTYSDQLTIPEINGASVINTITFKSATNDSNSVILNHTSTAVANWIVNLDGADYIIFKNIKFAPSDPLYSTAVIITNGATNNKITGNLFAGIEGTLGSQTLISIEASTLANSGNSIQGNYIKKGSIAISINGTASSILENTVIKNNIIENAVEYGIYAQYIGSTLIDSNTIISGNFNANKYGIYLQYAEVLNSISKNKINLTGGDNMYGISVENSISTDLTRGLIANNMVSILNGSSSAYGIHLNTVTEYKVYANSIITNGTNAAATSAINILSTCAFIDLKNNNLQSNRYPVYVEDAASVSASDYNNYYTTGTTFAYWNATAYANLTDLATASLKDSNSVSVNPYFSALTNLHTFNGLLKGKGKVLTEITTDIDGALRLNPPCIGADEYLAPANDASLITLLKPIGGCGLTITEDVKVVIKNAGSAVLLPNTITAHYKIDNLNTVVSELVNRTINAGDTIQFIFSAKANIAVSATLNDTTYKIRAWTDLTGDFAPANDSSSMLTVISMYLPSAPVVTNGTTLYATSLTLNAVSNRPIFWYDSPITTVSFQTGSSYTTPVLFATDTFYVDSKTSQTLDATIGNNAASQVYPFYADYGFSRSASLYQMNEIGGYGMVDRLEWNVTTDFSAIIPIKIYLKQITDAEMTSSDWDNLITGATLVFDGTKTFDVIGWNPITLNAPYNYSSGNLMVLCEANYDGYGASGTPYFAYSNAGANSHQYARQDYSAPSGNCNLDAQRPDIKIFGTIPGCESARVPIIATVTIPDREAGISAIIAPTGCGLYQVPISIKIVNNGSNTLNSTNTTVAFKLDNGSYITPEAINIVILPFDTVQYTFTALADFTSTLTDRYIKVTAKVITLNDALPLNDILIRDSILSRFMPPLPTANNVSIINGNTATLTATASNGIPYWFNQITGGNSIGQGSPFITPSYIYVTDTFYVEANINFAGTATLGTETATNGIYDYPSPYGNSWRTAKHQILITKTELNTIGIQAGPITSLAFDVERISGGILNNFEIKMGHTSITAMVIGSNYTNLNSVYTNASYTDVLGWNTHILYTPFVWNGLDNIIIQTCFYSYPMTNNAQMRYTPTTYNSVAYSSGASSSLCSTGISTEVSMNRPNLRIQGMVSGCSSTPRVPVIVTVSATPQNDAGITALVNPVGSTLSGISTPVKVKIKNIGQANLTTVAVAWTLNNVAKPVYNFTGNIPSGSDTTITLSNETFSGGLYCIKAWTQHPNGALTDSTASNDTLFSTCFTVCLSGNYTIGNTTGGNYDFTSFNSAVSTLKQGGVCGPVTFLIDTGTYTEQVRISEIAGASALNTITFRSAVNDSTKVKLEFAATFTSPDYTLKLDSADYIRFEKMSIKAIGTVYSNVIVLVNGATNNNFSNNIIEMPFNSTADYVGIYVYYTAASLNKYQNNRILNGYDAISISANDYNGGNQITGNQILNFSHYGINAGGQDSIKIIGNEIRSDKLTNLEGIHLGYSSNNIQIIKNKIILSGGGDNAKNGIYMSGCSGTATARGLIANNMISLSGGSLSSTNHGLDIVWNNFLDFYYNSVNIADITNYSTNYGSGIALYLNGGSQHNFKNNNFTNTGGDYAFYDGYGSSDAIDQSDNNNFFTTGAVTGYWNYADAYTLADLQAASTKDVNSVSVNPMYTSLTDLHLLSSGLSTLGTPVTGITDDIDGFTRDIIKPTIGADEVPLLQKDAALTFIINPAAVETEASSVAVKVAVKNFGIDPITTMTISYVLNNGTPVNYTYNGSILSFEVDTVTLPVNINVVAGNNSICAYTTLAGDGNTFNNQICKNFMGTTLFDAQLSSISPILNGCSLTTDTVKILIVNQGIMAISGGLTASYQTLGGTAIVTDIINSTIAAGDSLLYSFTTPVTLAVGTTDSLYKIKAWVTLTNDNTPANNLDTLWVNSLHTPANAVTGNVSIPYATSATLTASSATNDPLKWYDVQTNGNLLYTGSPFNTSLLYATDTFYVQSNTMHPINMEAGSVTSTTSTAYPFYGYAFYSRSADLYQASETGGFGIINELQWKVTTPALSAFPVKIYLAKTTLTSMTPDTWDNLISNSTLVYDGIQTFDAAGWKSITLTTPYVYTSDNLMVLCETNYGDYTSGAYFKSTETSINGSHQQMYSDWPANTPPTGTGNVSKSRPNIKFIGNKTGCSNQRMPAIITVGAQPAIDAGAVSIVSPNTGINLGLINTVKVLVKNFGSTAINNFPVKYKLDNNLPVIETITTSLAPNSVMEYTFTQTVDLSSYTQPQTFNIIAWSELSGDPTHQNDTTKKTVINNPPLYCISTALQSGSAYDKDLGQVIFAGISNGNPLPVLNNPAATELYTNYTALTPATVQLGMSYPISLSIIFSDGPANGKVNAYIDFNQNGTWDLPEELVFSALYNGTNLSTVTGNVYIPYTSVPGYTRMRIVADESLLAAPCGTYGWGETEDYTINIAPPISHDGGISKMNVLGTFVPYTASNTQPAQFYIRNYGSTVLTNASMNYVINGAAPITQAWTGSLPYLAMDPSIQNLTLVTGMNTITAYTNNITGDINYNNDTIHARVFKEYGTTLPYVDNFEVNKYWFATDTASGLSINNLWEQGIPVTSSSSLNAAHSPVNVWSTKLSGNYPTYNLSILYTPVFDINTLKPDTLKFWQWRQFGTGTTGKVEYRNENGIWLPLGIQNDTNATNWYNDVTNNWVGFDTTWNLSKYCVKNLPNLGNTVQFRYVFISGTSTATMKGWAIDDFELTLASIPYDGGIIAITSPSTSSLVGDLVTVTVTVKNFGTATLSNFPVKYQVGNGNIVSEIFTGSLLPDATTTYNFTTPYQVGTQNYNLCAYTSVAGDLYTQNDKTCKNVTVNPALNDVGITAILQPGTSANPGPAIVKVVIKNFGSQTQSSIPVTYRRGNLTAINETWTGSLAAGDTALYTFSAPLIVPNGTSINFCSYTNLPNDAYRFNDSICKSVLIANGIDDIDENSFWMGQNLPNPATGLTTIEYNLPTAGEVKFDIMNLLSQKVYTVSNKADAGKHSIDLNVNDLSAGVYYYTIEFKGKRLIKKMVINK